MKDLTPMKSRQKYVYWYSRLKLSSAKLDTDELFFTGVRAAIYLAKT